MLVFVSMCPGDLASASVLAAIARPQSGNRSTVACILIVQCSFFLLLVQMSSMVVFVKTLTFLWCMIYF